MNLKEYMDAVAALKGQKIKVRNPAARAVYEQYSLEAGRWLTAEEFEARYEKYLEEKYAR